MAKDRRDPDLWLSPTAIRIEPAKKSHKKRCSACGEAPQERRLKVVVGSSRSATTVVLCESCGNQFLCQVSTEAQRAANRLVKNDETGCRVAKAERILDIAIQNEKIAAQERKAKREAAKQ